MKCIRTFYQIVSYTSSMVAWTAPFIIICECIACQQWTSPCNCVQNYLENVLMLIQCMHNYTGPTGSSNTLTRHTATSLVFRNFRLNYYGVVVRVGVALVHGYRFSRLFACASPSRWLVLTQVNRNAVNCIEIAPSRHNWNEKDADAFRISFVSSMK